MARSEQPQGEALWKPFLRGLFSIMASLSEDGVNDCYCFDFNMELSEAMQHSLLAYLKDLDWIDDDCYHETCTAAYKIADTLAFASACLDTTEYNVPANMEFIHNENGMLYGFIPEDADMVCPDLTGASPISFKEIENTMQHEK